MNSASLTALTRLEVFRFCTRLNFVCCNNSCKNLCFAIMQKLCRIQHAVTKFTVCSKVVSNVFAIHQKRAFKRANAFSTLTRLLLSARVNLASSGLRFPRSEQGFMSQFSKKYSESPSIKGFISTLPICFRFLQEESSFSDTLFIRVSS